jgi:hypothetical protein
VTNRNIILLIAIAVVVTGVLALSFWKSSPPPPTMLAPKTMQPAHSATAAPAPSFPLANEYSQISIKNMSREKAVDLYLERENKDHEYDWKVSLNFYGNVVDENDQPVVGATAKFGWTTIGTIGNYSKAEALSDEMGLFSLTGQHGKNLGVRVEKQGYDTVEGGLGEVAFEYAEPSDRNYYEPDPNNPVIFHLRKKGEGAKLFSKKLDFSLYGNVTQEKVNLMAGFIKPDGQLLVQANKPDYRTAGGRFPWSVTLTMSEGGLYETKQQFPYQAPQSGYASTMVINMTDPTQPDWSNRP